jgi:hypothetical protein
MTYVDGFKAYQLKSSFNVANCGLIAGSRYHINSSRRHARAGTKKIPAPLAGGTGQEGLRQ